MEKEVTRIEKNEEELKKWTVFLNTQSSKII